MLSCHEASIDAKTAENEASQHAAGQDPTRGRVRPSWQADTVNGRPVVAEVYAVRGHQIRLTLRQWVHIIENHDYMAGNRELVLETVADPDELLEGEADATLALRAYPVTNLTAKTVVVVYRDEPNGFVITAWLTSRPDRVRARGKQVWTRSASTGG
jgi:hypothetical protein